MKRGSEGGKMWFRRRSETDRGGRACSETDRRRINRAATAVVSLEHGLHQPVAESGVSSGDRFPDGMRAGFIVMGATKILIEERLV